MNRCNSKTACVTGSKVKAILPAGYRYKKCVNCLERARQSKNKNANNKSTKKTKSVAAPIDECCYCGLNNEPLHLQLNKKKCCQSCYTMKANVRETTFILRCAHIFYYNSSLKHKYLPHLFDNFEQTELDEYSHLPIKTIKELSTHPCYYCGKVNSKNHQNGIVTLTGNSKQLANLQSCCQCCKDLKGQLDNETFKFKCILICGRYFDTLGDLIIDQKSMTLPDVSDEDVSSAEY